MDSSYAEVGAEVILLDPNRIYQSPMVGQKATINSYPFVFSGNLVCSVACNKRSFWWRIQDMILASDVSLLTEQQKTQLKIK